MVIVTVIFNIIFFFSKKSTLFQAQKPLISSMLCFYNHVCCSFLWFCFYIIRVKIKIFNKSHWDPLATVPPGSKSTFIFICKIIVILPYLLHHIELKRLSHLFNKFIRFSFRIYRWSASYLLWSLVQFHTRTSVRLSLRTLFNLKEAEN